MTVLVVASPCALIISTPASILSAIANAAHNGILFKGGAYLEQAASITTIAFDKTGTLTTGSAELTDIVLFSRGRDRDGITKERILEVAASAEQYSEHHVAAAVVRAARSWKVPFPKAENVQAEIGKGVKARVRETTVWVGNKKLFDGHLESVDNEAVERIRTLEQEGKTIVYVGMDGEVVGALAFADQVREQAPLALETLRKLGVQKFVILTGDLEGVAQTVARRLNIGQYHAELLPEKKVEVIRELARQDTVAMVGDGVNDAPALASSSLGIAMGAVGTDVALETADVVLMADDLTKLPYMINLAQRARSVVWQNIVFSLTVIAVLVASVFLFELPLPLGVVGHEGSTLLVVMNGLRLLRS
jgi:Cd2+/Zn2+-exporting ATPase